MRFLTKLPVSLLRNTLARDNRVLVIPKKKRYIDFSILMSPAGCTHFLILGILRWTPLQRWNFHTLSFPTNIEHPKVCLVHWTYLTDLAYPWGHVKSLKIPPAVITMISRKELWYHKDLLLNPIMDAINVLGNPYSAALSFPELYQF